MLFLKYLFGGLFTTLLLSHSLFSLSFTGDVCVRVPPSLKAGVELCGASVDVSSEVVLHRTESRHAEGQITVVGKLSLFITPHSSVQLIN